MRMGTTVGGAANTLGYTLMGMAAAGYPGVRYLLRHDPKQDLVGIAVFGPAGAPSEDAAELPTPVSKCLDHLGVQASRLVIPRPVEKSLEISKNATVVCLDRKKIGKQWLDVILKKLSITF
jgi:hypothetical protein